MNKFLTLIAALAFAALAAGCNTIEGAGKDIKKAGEKIEDAASKKK
jgi:predicted small secreted protein